MQRFNRARWRLCRCRAEQSTAVAELLQSRAEQLQSSCRAVAEVKRGAELQMCRVQRSRCWGDNEFLMIKGEVQ